MKRLTRVGGYTLIEMLVATALTLTLVLAVSMVFAQIGRTVNNSRSTLETMDALRATAARLQKDLEGHTCLPMPPCRPDDGLGYIEVIEGPNFDGSVVSIDSDSGGPDETVGDPDDILLFTTHTSGQPFVGLFKDAPIEADVAEVAWFIRGNVLYRRCLLVAPGVTMPAYSVNYFATNDVSARVESPGGAPVLVANTLGDLTKRECRYAHDRSAYPFPVSWGNARLPTLGECALAWPAVITSPPASPLDYWRSQPSFGNGPRAIDDVMLRNVIGFDVKVWDSGAGTYVDINGPGATLMTGNGFVYDSGSFHYEHDGLDQDGVGGVDQGTNGYDDNADGVIDDSGEYETAAIITPYPVPLRGIQVKIRVFEPDSRQIREVTVVQDFLPK